MLPRAIIVIDGSSVTVDRAESRQPWGSETHCLNSVDRLLTCCEEIARTCENVRVLVFVTERGYKRLRLRFESSQSEQVNGVTTSLAPSSVQCVPFGCQVADFLLEFASRKAAEGLKVAVVSNAPDVVAACRDSPLVNLSHQAFMFVEDDVILPGLRLWHSGCLEQQSSLSNSNKGEQQSLELTPNLKQAPNASVRTESPPRKRLRILAEEEKADDSETLHDSQLDGEELDVGEPTDAEEAKTRAYDDEAYQDTQLDFEPSPRGMNVTTSDPSKDIVEAAYADTLVVEDVEADTFQAKNSLRDEAEGGSRTVEACKTEAKSQNSSGVTSQEDPRTKACETEAKSQNNSDVASQEDPRLKDLPEQGKDSFSQDNEGQQGSSVDEAASMGNNAVVDEPEASEQASPHDSQTLVSATRPGSIDECDFGGESENQN